jgi:hypothetical protein
LSGGVTAEAQIAVPPGTRLISADLQGDRALLQVDANGATSLLLLDLATGQIIGRYALQPQ